MTTPLDLDRLLDPITWLTRRQLAILDVIRELRRLDVPPAEFWVRLDAALDGAE